MPENVKPLVYDLHLVPDFEKLNYQCDENILVEVTSPTKTVQIHSKEIDIKEVSIDAPGFGKAESITYDEELTVHTFTWAKDIPVGKFTLFINFIGILNGDMAGFYKSTYTDEDGEKKIMGSTQFEATDARRAFPCWDEPAVKSKFKISITCAKHLTAISNMPETKVALLGGGLRRWDFDVSPIMSTYLLAWAIGEFDVVADSTKDGVGIRIFSPPGRASQSRFALDCSVKALEFYNDFFQVPYPLPKLDMLCVTEFAAGAMENWGLVTYREVALMVDDAAASPQTKQRVAIVVAHEIAHQWFGNLVTMEWWNGLWLNEGFAAWSEHFCVDALYPQYKIWDQFTTDAFMAAQRLDAMVNSHPIIVPIKNAEEVDAVFDAISYCKGSCVVNMVNAIIGVDAFRSGLIAYFKKHSYGNATTDDLWQAWSDASGKDIASMMSLWTMRKGYPYLTVVEETWNESSVTFTLEQNYFLSDGTGDKAEDNPIWQIPLLFASNKTIVPKVCEIMTEKRQSFTVDFGTSKKEEQWVKINSGQKALCRVAHSSEMIARLQPAIVEATISGVDRAALLLDSYELAKAGLCQPEVLIDLLKCMDDEDEAIVWSALATVLGGLNLLMESISPELHAAFKALGRKIVLPALNTLGWEPKKTDGHTDRLMRTAVLNLLSVVADTDESIVAEARRRFDGHFDDPSLLPTDFRSIVYAIVLQNGGEVEYEKLLASYRGTNDMQLKKYPLMTLGETKDEALKTRTLEWALDSEDVKLQDIMYPIMSVASSKKGRNLAWEFYKTNFAKFSAKLEKANTSLMDACFMVCLRSMIGMEAVADIETFFSANPLPKSVLKIEQMKESITNNTNFAERIKQSKISVEYLGA